jgi:hypothetical protein
VPEGASQPTFCVAGRFPAGNERELLNALRHVVDLDSRGAQTALDFGVLIDAHPDVSWPAIDHLIEVCQDSGFRRIEFASPMG